MTMKKQIILPLFVGVFVILACIPAVYFYMQYQTLQKTVGKEAAKESAKEEVLGVVAEVGKHLLLPTGEQPTLATVDDVEKLKQNSFFAQAQNGDKVLVYSQAKKAILYRPSIQRVVEVGPINVGTPSANTIQPTQAAEKPVSFILYNGTTIVGLTKKYETELLERVQAAKVVDRDNAKKRDYSTSMLIDIQQNKTAIAASLAQALDLTVSSMPDGETASQGADFLIILGDDKK